MPNKPKHINRSYIPEVKPFERDQSNDKFYNSWPWRKLRKRFLLNNPLCVHCNENDIITPATVVDHIVPINKGGAPLDELNLQPLCEHHHNSKSAKEKQNIK